MRRMLLAGLLVGMGCAGAPGPEPGEAARIERQLGDLYQPLLALIVESRESRQDFLKKEGRNEALPSDREPTEAELKRWIEKMEGDLFPRNDRMCALIRGKRDLVDGATLPASWQALLDHQDTWRADHEKWRKEGVPYPFHSRTGFPRSLERELRADIQRLEGRRDALRAKS